MASISRLSFQKMAEIDQIFRDAVACRECFNGTDLNPATIDVAQPRWIGPGYWKNSLKTLIVLLNPAAGKNTHDPANEHFRKLICAYRDNVRSIADVYEHKKREISKWGNLKAHYFDGFGLNLDEFALLNIAWCAEMNDHYPRYMLKRCFNAHSVKLLRILDPDCIVLGGTEVRKFGLEIGSICPNAVLIPVLHYAHRGGWAATQNEIDHVKLMLANARAEAEVKRAKG